MKSRNRRSGEEPTDAELAAIEAEWPLIEAELALLDAQIVIACGHGPVTELDWRRLRRAQAQVLRAYRAVAAVVPTLPAA